MGILRHRRRPKLRPLGEAEAYARCHGQRNEDVKIVHLEPRRPRFKPHVSGERLREAFERKLDAREPEEAPETGEGTPSPDGDASVAESAPETPPEVDAGDPDPLELEVPSSREPDGGIAL